MVSADLARNVVVVIGKLFSYICILCLKGKKNPAYMYVYVFFNFNVNNTRFCFTNMRKYIPMLLLVLQTCVNISNASLVSNFNINDTSFVNDVRLYIILLGLTNMRKYLCSFFM